MRGVFWGISEQGLLPKEFRKTFQYFNHHSLTMHSAEAISVMREK